MEEKPYLMVRGINCHPDDVAKFVKWYDEVHIPMLMKFKGIESIVRGELDRGNKEKYPMFFAITTFKSKKAAEEYETCPELEAAKAEAAVTWKNRPFTSVWRAFYQVARTWLE